MRDSRISSSGFSRRKRICTLVMVAFPNYPISGCAHCHFSLEYRTWAGCLAIVQCRCRATLLLIALLFSAARISPGQPVTITTYSVSGGPAGITLGSDGAIWFTENAGNKIGRITNTGTLTEYDVPTPSSGIDNIASGPDGALWFTENERNNIGRITINGIVTEYAIPTPA